MHEQAGVRECAHQATRAAGVIEVDVGEHHPIHGFGRDAQRGERTKHLWHRGVATGIDDRRATVLHDDVDGGELRAAIA